MTALPMIRNLDGSFRILRPDRQERLPPVHHPIRLREKAVASQIHAIAVVIDRLGDAPYLILGFEDDRLYVGPGEQLIRCRQARRARPNDDDSFVGGRHELCYR